ncbi:MAG TPA: F0F1 ATP synthase subunit B [Pseudomonadales bacterium]
MNINLTLIGQSITFLVFVAFCMKFIWPVIVNAMAERQKTIAEGLEAADRADRDLELAKEKVTSQLRQAKEEAAAIIDLANKRASQIVEDAKKQAHVEGERIKAGAEAEIEQQVNRAREQLRGQLATLVIAGAEKVLESSVDASRHEALLNKLAAEL